MEVMNYGVLHCNFSFQNQDTGRGGTNEGRQDNTMYKTVTNDQMQNEKCLPYSHQCIMGSPSNLHLFQCN